MNYFMYGIKKYADFKGRASRAEFFIYLKCYSSLIIRTKYIFYVYSYNIYSRNDHSVIGCSY